MKTRVSIVLVWMAASGAMSLAAIPNQQTESPASIEAKTEQKRPMPRRPVSAGIADILKMAESGVDSSVIKSFAENYPVAYHPSADEIIALHDAGISSEIITALLRRTGEMQSKQVEAVSPAVALRSEVRKPAVVYETPQNVVQTVAPQPAAPPVTYVNSSYVYPTYPTYSYAYASPLYYSSAYCYRPYSYSYWPRSYCWPSWPSWPSYGVSVGFRSGFHSSYGARPAFGFHSYPRHSSRFVRR
jgi:hypothetical protein